MLKQRAVAVFSVGLCRPTRRALQLLLALALMLASACTDAPRRFFSACSSSGECESGLCYQGLCSHSCATSGDCDQGICVQKVCQPKDKAVCGHDSDCAALNDYLACSKGICSSGRCTSSLQTCSDGDACTQDLCGGTAPGELTCLHPPAVNCDDGNACTQDTCSGGTCPHAAIVCSDGDLCTTDSCAPASGCVYTAAVCDDQDPCTQDTCAAGLGCSHTPTSCDDSDACTTDSCAASSGCVHSAVVCDDQNPCTQDTCKAATGCSFAPADGTACSDGDACTSGDQCSGGKCQAGAPSCGCLSDADCIQDINLCKGVKVCDMTTQVHLCVVKTGSVPTCQPDPAKPCQAVSCDPLNGLCDVTTNLPDTTDCDADGSLCTANDHCLAGVCAAGSALACDDQNPCTDDSCLPSSGCQHTPAKVGTPCDDGYLCSGPDGCDGKGGCSGAPIACDDQNPCTDDSCQEKAGCVHAANTASCDDGYACSQDDHCAGGTCTATKLLWNTTLSGGGQYAIGRGVALMPSSGGLRLVVVGSRDGGTGSMQRRIEGLDLNGNGVWSVPDTGIGNTTAEAVAAQLPGAPNGGVAVVGETDAQGDGIHGFLLRLDADGKVLWQTQVKAGTSSDRLVAVAHRQQDWLVAGYRNDSGLHQPLWATVPDIAGKAPTTYTTALQGQVELAAAATNGAGDTLLVGTATNGGTTAAVAIRLNPANQQLFAKPLLTNQTTGVVHAAVAVGAGWAIAGTVNNPSGKPSMWLFRVDDQGSVLWQRTFDGAAVDAAVYGIAALPDGLALVGAGRPSAGAPFDALNVRTDLWGNLWYSRVELLANAQTLAAVTALPDGGLAAVGSADSGTGGSDILVMRTNPWGYAFCAEVGACLNLSRAACDDGSPCTGENCVASAGCTHNAYFNTMMCGDTAKCSAGKCL